MAAVHCLEGQLQLAAGEAFKRPGPCDASQEQRNAQMAFVEHSSAAAACIFLQAAQQHTHDWTTCALLLHWAMAARLGAEAAVAAHLLGHCGDLSLSAAAADMAVQGAATAAAAVQPTQPSLQAGASTSLADKFDVLSRTVAPPALPSVIEEPQQQQEQQTAAPWMAGCQRAWQVHMEAPEPSQPAQQVLQAAAQRMAGWQPAWQVHMEASEPTQPAQSAQPAQQAQLNPKAARQLEASCPVQGLGVVAMTEAVTLQPEVTRAHVTATHCCAMLALEGAMRASRLGMPAGVDMETQHAPVQPAGAYIPAHAAAASQPDVEPAPGAVVAAAAESHLSAAEAGAAVATPPVVRAPLSVAPGSDERVHMVRRCVLQSSRLLGSEIHTGIRQSGGDDCGSGGSGGSGSSLPFSPQPLCLLDIISQKLQAFSFGKAQVGRRRRVGLCVIAACGMIYIPNAP